MCGIFAVLRKPASRQPLLKDDVEQILIQAVDALGDRVSLAEGFRRAAKILSELNEQLKGPVGVSSLLSQPSLVADIERGVAGIDLRMEAVESDLDAGRLNPSIDLEELNRSLSPLRDVTWAIRRDRIRTAEAVAALGDFRDLDPHTIESYTSIQLALSAIDRLEVRGRDSAGISVIVQ